MMKYTGLLLVILLIFSGCSGGSGTGSSKIQFEIPFDGEQKIACEQYADYLKLMSEGKHAEAFEYEDFSLWPSLVRERYLELRATSPEFSSLLSKSKIVFTQCSEQPEWGIFGHTFTDAFMIAFELEPPTDLTPKEWIFADILADRSNVTVLVEIDGRPKFLPSVGPEILLIDNAMKAYNDYISAISNKEYEKIFDFTPSAISSVTPRAQIAEDWNTPDGHSISDFTQIINIEPIIGQIVFEPSVHTINYRWGVNLYVMMDLENIDEQNTTELQQVIIDDWRQGINSKVLMVPEGDEWKVSAENPLF